VLVQSCTLLGRKQGLLHGVGELDLIGPHIAFVERRDPALRLAQIEEQLFLVCGGPGRMVPPASIARTSAQ
jgi:hypothetical protein